jgi:DNA primase
MYTKEFIVELKKRISMVDLAGRYTKLIKGGDVWLGTCPHPDHDDDTPSFRVWHNHDGSWSWACMSCHTGKKDERHHNYGTDCIAFVRWMSDNSKSTHILTFREAVERLAKMYAVPVAQSKESVAMANLQNESRRYETRIDTCRNYLHGRGLSDEDISFWHLGYTGYRISFPIFTESREIVGFSQRLFQGEGPKYLTSKTSDIFKKSKHFYGQHILDKDYPYIFIAEGVFDVVLAHKYGMKNVVCPLGHDLTDDHIQKIKAWGYQPVLCFDADAAGVRGIRSSINKLAEQHVYGSVLPLPQGNDLAEFAQSVRSKLMDYVSSHLMSYWEWTLKEPQQLYAIQLSNMQRKAMPLILSAKKSIQKKEDMILFNQYVRHNFGITMGEDYESAME